MDSQPILVFPVPVSSPSSSNQIGNPTSFSPPSSIISRPPSRLKHSPISAHPEPTMASLAISFTPSRDLHLPSLSGLPMKPLEQSLANFSPMKLSLGTIRPKKANITKSERRLIVRAGYSDGGRQGGSSIFIGAFVLGGIIVGTLGCVYAPQISRALAGADKKDLMRKLPKFIYDEEKALEKTRKILAEKIEQLNSAIDDVSSQLRTDDDGVDGVSVPSVDEATV